MSRSFKASQKLPTVLSSTLDIKSKFDAEFRRFSTSRSEYTSFEVFRQRIVALHSLVQGTEIVLFYTDPLDGDLLPISNDDNFRKALQIQHSLLRVTVQRLGESLETMSNGVHTRFPYLSPFGSSHNKNRLQISSPKNFRQVASVDVVPDVVPEVCRRVCLLKHGTERPLGFYIRDGKTVRATTQGLERVPGIFISRLVPGGLAESTGLLAVNDEVLEVNGIEVHDKSLDQVTDMMVANSSRLIITVKPANQHTLHARGSSARQSGVSSHGSGQAGTDEDDDEVKDHSLLHL